MAASTAQLHWVRADDSSVVLSGGAVRSGKLVRLRADWQPSARYMGPEEFRIHEDGSLLARLREIISGRGVPAHRLPGIPAVGGPPVSMSRDKWLATASRVTRQSRYRFSDAHGNWSGPLTVSSVSQFTRQPHLEAAMSAAAGLPVGQASVTLTGSGGSIVHGIGATADPGLRVVIMTPWGSGEADLMSPVQELFLDISNDDNYYVPRGGGPDLRRALGWPSEPGPWIPSFASDTPDFLDVDEEHEEEIRIVPESPVPPGMPFRTAYALRVVNIEDSFRYVISDVVEIEGDGSGQLAFRS